MTEETPKEEPQPSQATPTKDLGKWTGAELDALVQLIDLGVKSGGIQFVQNAAAILQKIQKAPAWVPPPPPRKSRVRGGKKPAGVRKK